MNDLKSFLRPFFIVALLIPLAIQCTSGGRGGPRPNILIVLVDDMGYGHLGVHYEEYTAGNVNQDLLKRSATRNDAYSLDMSLEATRSSMPTLTKLAAGGVNFLDSHSGHSLCAPSRAALLTARYPQQMGIYNNGDMNSHGVPEDVLMLPELFQQNGYSTAMIGKWHVARYDRNRRGFAYDGQHPNDRGFDYYFGFNHSGTPYYDSEILYRNKEKAEAEGYTTDQFTREAGEFIRKNADNPFFVYLAYNCPHGPLNRYAPEEYDKLYKDLPRVLRIWNSYMFAVDEGIRRILETLEETGDLDNTLIFFLSDNGASGSTPLPANGYYRGHKGSLYMGGTRSGMVAWWPGVIPGGSVCDKMVSSMDVLPTCLDAAGIKIPKGLSIKGKSLLPLLRGRSSKAVHETLVWANRNSLNWSYPGSLVKTRDVPAAWTIKNEQWVLHYFAGEKKYYLYDAVNDVGEKKNLAIENPETVEAMKKEYAAWFATVRPPVSWDKEVWLGLKPAESLSPEEAETLDIKNRLLMEKIRRKAGK